MTGAASQFTEVRAGHKDANGNFVNPTVVINGGADTISGRSIINDRSVCAQAQEHVPEAENIRALRAALNTLGDGFVEAIDDNTLTTIAAQQVRATHGKIHGEVIAELERLRASDTVRVIDALAVYKDQAGELEVEHLSNLTQDEAIELGTKIGALIGLGIDGEEGVEAGAEAGAEMAADGINFFGDADEWDVLEDIPNDSAAALILLEHHWAVPLRDAIARAGGFRISDGFISPLDLVGIGLMTAEEAKELHTMETTAAAKS